MVWPTGKYARRMHGTRRLGPWAKAIPLAAPSAVVAVDFGAKRNILRCLAATGSLTVVLKQRKHPIWSAHKPDGVFLSNGPGDPAATGVYAVEMVKALLAADVPTAFVWVIRFWRKPWVDQPANAARPSWGNYPSRI